MKASLSILFTLFLIPTAFCQVKYNATTVPKLPMEGANITYTGTIALDSSYSKEKLFDNAQQWYQHNLQSADNTLNINDIDAGKLSGTGVLHARNKEKDINPQDLFFTVTIYAAKGGYKYRVDSVYSFENKVKFFYSDMYSEELYTIDKPKWTKPYRQNMLTSMNTRINAMTDKLKAGMTKR